MKHHKIAYLAPEIPALSATFVYEEMLALEGFGYIVQPYSIRVPEKVAFDQQAVSDRTEILYSGSKVILALSGLHHLIFSKQGKIRALRWLIADIATVGFLKLSAWKLVFQFLIAARLAHKLRNQKCTHLHVHFANTPAQIGMYASALSGVPFTLTAHANDIFERGILLCQKANRAKKFITISEYNRAYLQNLGIPRHQLEVIRCGVSFPANDFTNTPTRTKIFHIGTLGRFVEKKGIDVLLFAVANLLNCGYAINVHIAGDGPLRTDLENLARKSGIQDVTYFDGVIAHNKISKWMQKLNVFVLPCKMDSKGDMDGIPVALMEAMWESIPVISTRLSGIPELIIDEVSGLLAEPNDHIDLARQITRIIDCEDLATGLVAAARTHVLQEFDQKKNIIRLIESFNLKPIKK